MSSLRAKGGRRGSTGVRTRRAFPTSAACMAHEFKRFPRNHAARNGPCRDRTCDLGIKSPPRQAVANCEKRKGSSSGSAAAKSSRSAPSSCSLSSLRLRIFSARAWPPRARSSGVKAWAGAPFLSKRDSLERVPSPLGSRRVCDLDCMLLIVGVCSGRCSGKNGSAQPSDRTRHLSRGRERQRSALKRKAPIYGAFFERRYWTRTSDPQLVEPTSTPEPRTETRCGRLRCPLSRSAALPADSAGSSWARRDASRP
jgi:hypothetical protein